MKYRNGSLGQAGMSDEEMSKGEAMKSSEAKPKGPSMPQRLVAEFLGTFVLLTVGIGGAIFGFASGINTGFIAIGVGVSIMVGIYAWGNISGGHYNPAVTMSFVASGRMKIEEAVPYWVVQVLGAIVGMAVIFGIAHGFTPTSSSSPIPAVTPQVCITSGGVPSDNIAYCTAMGATGYAGGGSPYMFSASAVVLLEIVATFLFTSVILFSTDKKGWVEKGFHGLAIGFTLMILVLLGVGVDGLSVNPARSTGSAVLASVAGVNWPIDQLWAFWVAPFVGAIIAGVLWRFEKLEGA